MKRTVFFVLSLLLLVACAVGCTEETPPLEHPSASKSGQETSANDGFIWRAKENIANTNYTIWLGYYDEPIGNDKGNVIQPAVAITQGTDDQPVTDAEVSNQLINPNDPTKHLSVEVETLFLPESKTKIAHYAQGALLIPKQATQCVIRFRIKLPSESELITRDIALHLEGDK